MEGQVQRRREDVINFVVKEKESMFLYEGHVSYCSSPPRPSFLLLKKSTSGNVARKWRPHDWYYTTKRIFVLATHVFSFRLCMLHFAESQQDNLTVHIVILMEREKVQGETGSLLQITSIITPLHWDL